jgi:hypothetical protein
MKYLRLSYLSLLAFFLLFSCSPSRNIQVSKALSNSGGPKTLVYSLPKTRIDIQLQVTKIKTIAGPYAAYAERFLTLAGAPTNDSEVYEITKVDIIPVNEPDPDHFYAISFNSYPANLSNLFTMTQEGLMLDLQNSWNAVSHEFESKYSGSGINFERSIYEPNIVEKIDTVYKTVLTDASFVKVPIYKKSMEIKNEEDKARNMADLILKIRKRRLKLMMGEYEYHPDGAALKAIVEELGKQETELMSHFIGKKITETAHYTYSIMPDGTASKELVWFSPEKGISETSKAGANAVSIFVVAKDVVSTPAAGKELEKSASNSIFFRSPVINNITVKLGNTVLANAKVPVYQSGKLQIMPVMP